MTPDERTLIMGLFDRLRGYGSVEKDRDAEALINTQVRQIPDSAYLMSQTVLVQDQALTAANARVQQLEARVHELESARSAAPSSGGSFLGGLFGGSHAAAPTSVPSRPMAPTGSPSSSPWGQPAQPQYQTPYQQAPMQQGYPMQAAPRAGGGFLANAMSSVVGVAGGMVLADSIRGMMGGGAFGGHHSQDSGAFGQSSGGSSGPEMTAAESQAAEDAQIDQDADNDTSNDPGNDPGSTPTDDVGGGWSDSGTSDA